MNPPSDNRPASRGVAASAEAASHDLPPANWREALMVLIATRLALLELESKDAAKEAIKRIALVAAACACGFFAWALLLAGGVSLISKSSDCSWDLLAIGVAFAHLLAAIILVQTAKKSLPPAFPVTRAEFKKDREWIEKFPKNKNSND
jgi:uncharacterized membrane protein YqjE